MLRAAASAILWSTGCATEPCEEDPRAQVLEQTVTLRLGGEPVTVELADDDVERQRGWRHRVCDKHGLLLVPPERLPLPIWGCELLEPIDGAFIRSGRIVELARVEPCPAPCAGCERVGEAIAVDAVLELPADAWALEVGMAVGGL